MASIQMRKRSDGTAVYRVMFRIDGQQTSESFAVADAAGKFKGWVEQFGGQQARDLRGARTVSLDKETLAAWFERYLATLTGIEAGTVAEYRRLATRTWLPELGQFPVEAINRDHVTAWVGRQAKTVTRRKVPTSAKTIANAHGLLSQTITAAVEEGLCASNPCRGVRLPRGSREEMVFLTHSEFALLFGVIPVFWRPLVMTLAGTGMRWGEATAVQWRDVDLDADVPVIHVVRAWKRGETTRTLGVPKTSRSNRTISLPPEVVAELRPIHGKGGALVFQAARGGAVHHQHFHPRIWKTSVSRAVQAGLGKTPRLHDLRHTHASWLIAAGVPLPVIQRRLGHESIQTTVDTYGHLADNALSIAADAASLALQLAAPTVLEGADLPGGQPAITQAP